MDHSYEKLEALFRSLLGLSHSKAYVDEKNVGRNPGFNPKLVIAHCFKQFKQDFHLPKSRRRIIILPQKEDPTLVNPRLQSQAPPQLISSFKALEARGIPGPPEDVRTWLNRRLKFRQELESFGNIDRWLQNKSSLTPSEAKILHTIHKEHHEPQWTTPLIATRATNKKIVRPARRPVPQLRLPKPSALLVLYSYLRTQKIKILEVFNKVDHSKNYTISREMFIMALKAVEVPLGDLEIEDIVIYLSSLGKHNSITMEILASTYKQWFLTQQRSMHLITKDSPCHGSAKRRVFSQHKSKKEVNLTPGPPKMDLLTVPVFDNLTEARPLTLEDMEDIGKRYRERRRQAKLTIPSIQFTEQCRLVRSGNKHFDDHCLPSTIPGEMSELIDQFRRQNFLVYLQCQKVCEQYGILLTEDILIKALLYPGDKIIFQKDQVRPIRQPGGYYSDLLLGPSLAMLKSLGFVKPVAKKTDKKQLKNMEFKEFEKFTRKLQGKSPHGLPSTHPNFFWPGHLLDKLRLYLPTVAVDSSLALFSYVQHRPHDYSEIYHSNH